MSSSQTLLTEAILKIKKGLYSIVVFSFFVNIFLLSAPIYMLQIYDRVLSSRSLDTLALLTLIIVLAILSLSILEAVRSSLAVKIAAWLERQLGASVLTGSITTQAATGASPTVQSLRDLNGIRNFMSSSEIFCFFDSPWAPIFLVFIFLLHPILGFIALAGAVILFCLALLNESLTRELLSESNQANITALQQAESAVRNADVITAMGMISNLVSRWDQANDDVLIKQGNASFRGSLVTSTSKFVRQLLQVAILGIGAWLVILGELTPGAMIAGSILMSRALAPVEQAISSWKSAISARGAYARLKLHLADMPVQNESIKLPEPEGKLSVEGVSYFHSQQAEPVLKGINFSLPAGKMLGIIGPSGSGKTTLIKLLLGNLKPKLGHVRLDGMDVYRWDSEDLGQYCGYLPQDIELFGGSISENIARMGEANEGQVLKAAQQAGCHEMILRLPNSYATQAGEGGLALSGGERQRVALARALYGDPRFMVLDEPNSHLDSLGEAALIGALKKLKEDAVTVVLIGHRPSVIQLVDYLLVLNNGQIQDFGAREEVLNRLSGNIENGQVEKVDS